MSISVRMDPSKAALDVITAAKSGLVTVFGSDAKEIAAPPTGSYIARIDSRNAGGTGVNNSMFTMRNTGPKTAYIRRLYLVFSSNAIAAAASNIQFGVARFAGTILPSAGTAIDSVKKRNTYPPACVSDIRTGGTGSVTTSTVVMETPDFANLSVPRSLGGIQVMDLDFGPSGFERFAAFELLPLEGMCIVVRLQTTIAGDTLTGHVEWDER